MKLRILIYYVFDHVKARRLADVERERKNVAMLRDAAVFTEQDAESCDRVYIMPDVRGMYRETVIRAYGDRVVKTMPPESSYEPKITAPILEALEDKNPVPPIATLRDEAQGSTAAELELMTKRELREFAAGRGIPIDPDLIKRDDLLAAILAATPS